MFKIGDKVTYRKKMENEKGIIKSIPDDDHAFVVYHCAGKWDRYREYTAARTRLEDLTPGWDDE